MARRSGFLPDDRLSRRGDDQRLQDRQLSPDDGDRSIARLVCQLHGERGQGQRGGDRAETRPDLRFRSPQGRLRHDRPRGRLGVQHGQGGHSRHRLQGLRDRQGGQAGRRERPDRRHRLQHRRRRTEVEKAIRPRRAPLRPSRRSRGARGGGERRAEAACGAGPAFCRGRSGVKADVRLADGRGRARGRQVRDRHGERRPRQRDRRDHQRRWAQPPRRPCAAKRDRPHPLEDRHRPYDQGHRPRRRGRSGH